MEIVRKDADALNISVELTLTPADYSQDFDDELKKYKNNVQIKGFRKGKVPTALIKKMYGKSILSDVISKSLEKGLFDYIEKEKLSYLAQPLPDRDFNQVIDLDPNNLQEHKFSFDLGLAPEFEVKGNAEADSYTHYNVIISDELIAEEVEGLRKRYGKNIEVTDSVGNMDIVTLDSIELDGKNEKEDGWKTDFNVLVDVIHDEKVKNEICTKKLGDTIEFDVYKLEDKDEAYINKYLLKLPEDRESGNMYRGTISKVSRVEPAEMNEEFFAVFGDESIVDEDSLKEFIKKDLSSYYENQSNEFLYREIMDGIIGETEVSLPEIFLKKYLKESNPEITDEILEKDFESFGKNMKWSLIKNKLGTEYKIEVAEEDLRVHFAKAVFSYMGNFPGADYSFVTSTVDRLMEDKEQVNKAYEEILADKVLKEVADKITQVDTDISHEDFVQKVKDLNAKFNNL